MNEKREKQKLRKKQLTELVHKNEKLEKSLPKYREKVEELGCYVESKEDNIQESKRKLEKKRQDLKQLIRVRISQLIQYIFPITIVQPKRYYFTVGRSNGQLITYNFSEVESSALDMVSALAEATHTTYIRDRWVYTDNSGELQHCIVAPSLPGSGNYSAYNVWGKINYDVINKKIITEFNCSGSK